MHLAYRERWRVWPDEARQRIFRVTENAVPIPAGYSILTDKSVV